MKFLLITSLQFSQMYFQVTSSLLKAAIILKPNFKDFIFEDRSKSTKLESFVPQKFPAILYVYMYACMCVNVSIILSNV